MYIDVYRCIYISYRIMYIKHHIISFITSKKIIYESYTSHIKVGHVT